MKTFNQKNEGLIISISQVIYEIDTQQGLAKLHHKTPDSENQPPVLMIHGFGSSSDVWFAYDNSLGTYFREKDMDCWALNLSNAISGDILTLAHEDLLTSLDFIFKKRRKPVIIVSHSMGGIISRVFTSPHFKHPYPLNKIEPMIQGIALLTVPNHGVGTADVSGIEETIQTLRNLVKDDKEPVTADLGLGFVQLTPKSYLITTLNRSLPLNPNITWLNGVGTFDKVVPRKTALFEESETKNVPYFKQREFPCDHMVYPFSSAIKKIIKAIPPLFEPSRLESKLKIFPAIHRHQPVCDWILEQLITPD